MIQVSAQPLGMVSNCTALLDGFFSIAASTMSTLETILLLNTCHSRFPLLVNNFYMKLQSQNCACTRQNLSINFTFWHKNFSLKIYYCTNVCLFILSTTLNMSDWFCFVLFSWRNVLEVALTEYGCVMTFGIKCKT